MINVVCLAKDQSEYSDVMLSSLTSFKRKIRVIDRTDNDKGYGWEVIRNNNGIGRLTSKMRELGIQEAIKDNPEGILFIDGDRIPNCDFYEAIKFQKDKCILFYAENDNRNILHEFTDVTKPCYQLEYSPFYSNCVYVPTLEIQKCLKKYGSCFDPRFDGNWGEEDRHFGDRLVWNGANIIVAPYKYHTSGEIKDRYSDGLNNFNFHLRIQLCKEMVKNGR